jgi:NAD(P)-dependent dehydrogenase (short-subunit alcohol dehydrogenase family)
MGLLDGKLAVVTGGGSGIGRATARRMTDEGARVAVLDLNGDAAQVVADEIDGLAYAVDVRDPDTVMSAITDAAAKLGGLHVLFNNAGISTIGHIHELKLDDWHRVIDVNLHGVFHGIRAAVPIMLAGGGGSIVSTSSISGTSPAAGESAYSAAKYAVIALTKNAAIEYGPTIRVNAVAPGYIHTAMTNPIVEHFGAHSDHIVGITPAGRIGEPEDVADVVVFLSSDLARFVTGQTLIVDGGLALRGSVVDGVLDTLTGGRAQL